MSPPLTSKQEEILKDVYYAKKNFFGRDKLYELVKAQGISRRQVATWLKAQEVAQLFQGTRKSKTIQSTVLKAPYVQIGIDLMDLQTLAHNGFHYILTAIDLFTKRAWAEPLKNKEAKTVASAMKKILNQMSQVPKSVRSDNGSEFVADEFKKLLETNQIKHVFSLPSKPQSNGQIERFNGILKRMIKMNKAYNDDPNWPKHLPTLVHNYNHSKQRVIQSTPLEAEAGHFKETHDLIEEQAKKLVHLEGPLLAVGDKVRIKLEAGGRFNWSPEIYTIEKVHKSRTGYTKPYYRLTNKDDELVKDKFYQNDVQLIPKIENTIKEPKKFFISKLIKPAFHEDREAYVVKWKHLKIPQFEFRDNLILDVPKLVEQFEKKRKVKWGKDEVSWK